MPTLDTLHVDALRDTVVAFRDAVRSHAPRINRLNVYPVPDGDTGTNMARTLDAVVDAVGAVPAEMGPTCAAISHGSLMGARGNSGVILSQILRGMATTLSAAADADARAVADALLAASHAAYSAVLKPIEGTILTVVRAAAEGAAAAADGGAPLLDTLRAARAAGDGALARTPEMLPVLKEAGVVDAGGAGFLLLLDAALHVVAGDPMPLAAEPEGPDGAELAAIASRAAAEAHAHGLIDVSELRYEVMYLLDIADARIEQFKQAWGSIGDSIVVVGGDGLWNCHVHTNDIGAAIEAALDADGRPRSIRVTDLFDEIAEQHARREAELAPPGPAAAGLPPVTCAVVAVCSGDGLAELFGQLGVQGVVTGGQTMNPSTAELLDAVERVNADQVVVLPNNKNIVAVAQKVDALTTKKVAVAPTHSMAEALAALVVYDPELSADRNAAEMLAAASVVVTGEVTRAVRDSGSDAGPVNEGDWIGLVRGDGIAAVAPTLGEAATVLLDQLVRPDSELLTIIEGADAPAAVTSELQSWLAEHRPGVQVEHHRGGQPLYPYLFGVE